VALWFGHKDESFHFSVHHFGFLFEGGISLASIGIDAPMNPVYNKASVVGEPSWNYSIPALIISPHRFHAFQTPLCSF
jgi:hypothetical protein